jgi:photosystem II stability/assembly factor-like uncharacterized protein
MNLINYNISIKKVKCPATFNSKAIQSIKIIVVTLITIIVSPACKQQPSISISTIMTQSSSTQSSSMSMFSSTVTPPKELTKLTLTDTYTNLMVTTTTMNNEESVWELIGSEVGIKGVSSIAIDPNIPTTIYVGTLGLGLFRSMDGGSSWNRLAGPSSQDGYKVIAIDPVTSTTLYVGTYVEGVYKSVNSGMSWNKVNVGLPIYNDIFLNQAIVSLVINPADPETLYAAMDKRGVYKSADGGENWIGVNNGLPDYPGLSDMVMDPIYPIVLYAATHQNGVFKTRGGGGYWYQVRYGMTTENDRRISSLAIHPTISENLYAGCYGGKVFKSNDAGATWININKGLPKSKLITDIAIDPYLPSTVYVGTMDHDNPQESGIFKSTDGGGSWTKIGLANMEDFILVIDPVIPTTLYAGTMDGLYVIHQVSK